MPDLSLDLRNLKCVEAVARYGSFRLAASALGLSQSTVTRRIQHLEHRLGVQAFSRSKTGSKLTTAGEGFLRQARIGAAHFREAISLARASADRQCLRVGIVGSIAGPRTSALLREYRRQHPHTVVIAEEVTSDSGTSAVRGGRLDIAIVLTLPPGRACEGEVLVQEQILVVVPKSHRLASNLSIHWSDLSGETLLLARQGYGPEMRELLKSEAAALATNVAIHDISVDNLLSMTAMGFGATLCLASSRPEGHPSVAVIPLSSDVARLCSRAVWLCSNANPALSPLLRLLRQQADRNAPAEVDKPLFE